MEDWEIKAKEEDRRRPRAVAAREGSKYIPELMAGGFNWIVGDPQPTHEEAKAVAQVQVDACNKAIESAISAFISSRGYKKAKGQ